MSRSPQSHPRHLLVAVLVAALLVVTASCSSSSGDVKAKGKDERDDATTTTTAAAAGTVVSTTAPAPLDPEDIDGGEQAYVDAMIPLMTKTTGLSGSEGAGKARCLAPKWVAAIGIATFAEAGIEPGELDTPQAALAGLGLSQEQADEMAGAFSACDVDLASVAVEQILTDSGGDQDVRACLEEAITQEKAEAALVANLLGQTNPSQAFTAAQACMTDR